MISPQKLLTISVIGKIVIGVTIGMIKCLGLNHLLLLNLPSRHPQTLIHGGIGWREIVNGIGIIVGPRLNPHLHLSKAIGGIHGILKVLVVHGGALEQAYGIQEVHG